MVVTEDLFSSIYFGRAERGPLLLGDLEHDFPLSYVYVYIIYTYNTTILLMTYSHINTKQELGLYRFTFSKGKGCPDHQLSHMERDDGMIR